MSLFKRAERKQVKLRLACVGCSGSGKTYSALRIAKGMGGKIAFIDTEKGSASLYSHLCEFDTLELGAPFTPERYVQAIKDAENNGYSVLIIDSLSHAWAGEGGVLEMVDSFTASSKNKNSFTSGWSRGTPEQHKLINAILNSKIHIICCLRTKTAYELQLNKDGKKVPVKIGLAPVQRENVEYEFTMIFDIDHETHFAMASKNRTSLFNGDPFLITEQVGVDIMEWMHTGVFIDDSKLEEKKQSYLDKIDQSDIDSLVDICKKAKEDFSNDINFHEELRKKYSARKTQLEFISEMGGTPDQRVNDEDVPQ